MTRIWQEEAFGACTLGGGASGSLQSLCEADRLAESGVVQVVHALESCAHSLRAFHTLFYDGQISPFVTYPHLRSALECAVRAASVVSLDSVSDVREQSLLLNSVGARWEQKYIENLRSSGAPITKSRLRRLEQGAKQFASEGYTRKVRRGEWSYTSAMKKTSKGDMRWLYSILSGTSHGELWPISHHMGVRQSADGPIIEYQWHELDRVVKAFNGVLTDTLLLTARFAGNPPANGLLRGSQIPDNRQPICQFDRRGRLVR